MNTEAFETAMHLAGYLVVLVSTGWLSYRVNGWLLVFLFGRIYTIRVVTAAGDKVYRVKARSHNAAITKFREISNIKGDDECQS